MKKTTFLPSVKLDSHFTYHVGIIEQDVFWSLYESSDRKEAQKYLDSLISSQPEGQWAFIEKKSSFKVLVNHQLKTNENTNTGEF